MTALHYDVTGSISVLMKEFKRLSGIGALLLFLSKFEEDAVVI